MESIVFLDRSTIGPSVTISRPDFEHTWTEYETTDSSQIIDRLSEATIVITNKVPLRKAVLEKLPNLKMIAVAATGFDVIDIDYCAARGITVSNIRGYANITVPEHTLALMFALKRSLVGYREDVINGEWEKSGQFCFFNHSIRDLAGSTLGIIGKGRLGESVAKLAEGLGMNVQYSGFKNPEDVPEEIRNSPEAMSGLVPFDEFLETSDVISLHCPLTAGTRDLLGMAEFQKMKRKPIVINTARGGLVNEADLVSALDMGLISGVGFDCLTSEPMAEDHPFKTILDRPNVIITPHVAWASEEAMQILWDQVVSNIENFSEDTPSNVVC